MHAINDAIAMNSQFQLLLTRRPISYTYSYVQLFSEVHVPNTRCGRSAVHYKTVVCVKNSNKTMLKIYGFYICNFFSVGLSFYLHLNLKLVLGWEYVRIIRVYRRSVRRRSHDQICVRVGDFHIRAPKGNLPSLYTHSHTLMGLGVFWTFAYVLCLSRHCRLMGSGYSC